MCLVHAFYLYSVACGAEPPQRGNYRLILQFQVENSFSLLVVSGDLCSLPHIVRVGDPDPGVLKQTQHNIYSLLTGFCEDASSSSSRSFFCSSAFHSFTLQNQTEYFPVRCKRTCKLS